MKRPNTTGRSVLVALLLLLTPIIAHGEAVDLDSLDIVLRAVPDGPIAHVDGASVPAEDFVHLYRSDLARVQRENPNLSITDGVRVQVALQTMGSLIKRELLYAEARQRNLSVPAAEVESEWENELERLRYAFADEESPMSEARILERAGTTREEAIRELEKALLIDKMRREVFEERGDRVSSNEIEAFFDEHGNEMVAPATLHLKQIFISGNQQQGAGNRQEAARRRAEEALNRIRAGQSFEAVARELSEGEGAEQGGDLGPRAAEHLPPFYVSAAASLEPGGVSNIIESEFGLHIIKLVDREEGAAVDFDEIAPRIRAFLEEERKEEAVRAFVSEKLNDGSNVRIYLDLERQLAFRPDLLRELGMTE